MKRKQTNKLRKKETTKKERKNKSQEDRNKERKRRRRKEPMKERKIIQNNRYPKPESDSKRQAEDTWQRDSPHRICCVLLQNPR